MNLSPASPAAPCPPRQHCHRCGGTACFRAGLHAPASPQALHELGACGRHFADVVHDLTCLARACDLADGQVTLEAIDPAPASPATRIPSSVPLTTIDVAPAPAA